MTTNASATTKPSRAATGGPARTQAALNGQAPTTRGGRAPATRRRPTTTTPGKPQTDTPDSGHEQWDYPVTHALLAAEKAVHRTSVHLHLPVIGSIHLPSKEELAFIGGVAGLATVGILEWPVAILLAIGHTLATNRHNRLMREFGAALEEA